MVEYNVSGGVVFAGSRILMPVAVATVLPSGLTQYIGTIATILSPVAVSATVVASISMGTIAVSGGTIQSQPALYAFRSASGTIKASAGVLYSVLVAGETGIVGASGGTLLVLDAAGTIAVVPVASGGFQPAPFGPGVSFSSLFASLMGSIDATFVYI